MRELKRTRRLFLRVPALIGRLLALGKRVISTLLVSIGAWVISMLLLNSFSLMLTGVTLGLVFAGLLSLWIGAALWYRWRLPLGIFCLLLGAWYLGQTMRSPSPEVQLPLAVGAASFVAGFLLLKYQKLKEEREPGDPEMRTNSIGRLLAESAVNARDARPTSLAALDFALQTPPSKDDQNVGDSIRGSNRLIT